MPRAGVGHTQGYLANSVINYFHLATVEINEKSGSSIFLFTLKALKLLQI